MSTNGNKVNTPPHVVVVDYRMHDFMELTELAQRREVRMTFLTSGSAALRVVDRFPEALWLVAHELPDVSGMDLLTMLRDTERDLSVFFVDSLPNRQREQAAWKAGATSYLCKPVSKEWIVGWRGRRLPPIHAPPSTERDARICIPEPFGKRPLTF